MDQTKQCAHFWQILPLTKRRTDKQIYIYKTRNVVNTYLMSRLPHFMFYICLSIHRFVEGKICSKCAQFCLVHIK